MPPFKIEDFVSMFFFAIIAIIAYKLTRTTENPQHWQHSFADFEFSAEEFYVEVQRAVTKREIPGIFFGRITYSQQGMLSNRREYLHILKGEHQYDICAAP